MNKTLMDALSNALVSVQEAESGDHIAARQLVVRAVKEIEEGRLNDPALRSFIAQGLTSLLSDKPNNAFHLRKRKGPRGRHSDEMQELIADSIEHSDLGFHKADVQAHNPPGAYTWAAGEFNISRSTAEKYHKKYAAKLKDDQRIKDEFRQEHENE